MNIIVDIDGTIANLEHRLHFISGEKKDWDAFHAHVAGDKPIYPVIAVVQALAVVGHTIHLVSGRMERCREDTLSWLGRHDIPLHQLHMRPEGDYRPDTEIKHEILFRDLGGPTNVLLAIDDRSRIVALWRSLGIRTMQVADGEY